MAIQNRKSDADAKDAPGAARTGLYRLASQGGRPPRRPFVQGITAGAPSIDPGRAPRGFRHGRLPSTDWLTVTSGFGVGQITR